VALEKLEYPDTGTVTASWLPTRNPFYEGRREKREWGVIPQLSSGKKAYLYEQGLSCNYYMLSFSRMPGSEWTSYLTFRNTVLGAKIKFTDFAAAAHTCTFWSWDDEATPSPGNRRSWSFTLREEL